MKRSSTLRSYVCGCVLPMLMACAFGTNATTVQVGASVESLALDGRLDDAVWSSATYIDELRQVSPHVGAPANLATQVKLLHDGQFLYLGVRAADGDGQSSARHTARDADLAGDDHIAFVFDPAGGGRNGYVFRINVNGAQQDALIFDGAEERDDWDAIWSVHVARDEQGWSAEVAIPFDALSGAGDGAWGFNVERYRAATGERTRWQAVQADRDVTALREAGRLTGLPAAASGHGVRIKPSLRFAYRDRRDEARGSTSEWAPSLDAFWRPRPGASVTLTLNTDFAEAEVDDRQVNLSRFPLFMPEKREFFLQDSGVFAFGGLQENVLPFFSRRIGLTEDGLPLDLDAGLKLAYESRTWEAGLLATRVESAGDTEAASVGVARVAARIGEHARLGTIATLGNTNGTDGSSLWGADWQYRHPNFVDGHALKIDAWAQSSRNDPIGAGRAYGIAIDWPNIGVIGNVTAARIDEGYAPALGFVAETGIELAFGEIGYWWRTQAGGDVIPQLDWEWSEGLNDARAFRMLNPEIYIGDARGNYVMPEVYFYREQLIEDFEILPGLVIPAGEYRYTNAAMYSSVGNGGPLVTTGKVAFGEFYGGRRQDVTVELEARPSSTWGASLRQEYTRLNLPNGAGDVHLSALGIDLTPHPFLAASLLLQWDDISEEVGANLRIRWTIAPGRDLFISLNQLMQRDRNLATQAVDHSAKLSWNWQW